MKSTKSAIQRNAMTIMTVFMAASFLFAIKVEAQKAELITVKSTKNFDATVNGIKKSVSNAGMMVLAEINHGKILSMTGLTLNAESLFIGNPSVGKNAFTDNAAVGLAIPLRVNIYEDNGVTYINYFTPSSELGYFQGDKLGMIGKELDNKIAMLTGMFSE